MSAETKRMMMMLMLSLVAACVLILTVTQVAHLDADQVVLVLFVLAGVAVNIYLPLYSTRRWWDTGPGRALWIKALGNCLVIDMALGTLVFGEDYPGRWMVRIVAMTVFTFGMWYLLITLLRAPRRAHPYEEYHDVDRQLADD